MSGGPDDDQPIIKVPPTKWFQVIGINRFVGRTEPVQNGVILPAMPETAGYKLGEFKVYLPQLARYGGLLNRSATNVTQQTYDESRAQRGR